jgi:hypothetical protein
MDRRILVFLALAAACSSSSDRTGGTTTTDSAGGTVSRGAEGAQAGSTLTTTASTTERGTLDQNLTGRIPVLEYHVIGGDRNELYTRTVASYRADLDTVYKLGYRPITIAQMLDKDFSEVPPGMSPVVFVYDDASPSQFRYLERDGKLEIDPTSGMGIWLDFAKSHPGWKNRGTYCLLNGAEAGHNFFGDKPKFDGQKNEWRFQKVKWLADNGFELCDHTLWHMKLSQYPDAAVQEQIVRNAMGIDSAVPGYRIRTMALPYGLWPKNRELAWKGSWTDPRTGKTHSYNFQAVLEVAGGPARSPYDPQFNPKSINRIQAVGDQIASTLTQLTTSKTRFVPRGKDQVANQ